MSRPWTRAVHPPRHTVSWQVHARNCDTCGPVPARREVVAGRALVRWARIVLARCFWCAVIVAAAVWWCQRFRAHDLEMERARAAQRPCTERVVEPALCENHLGMWQRCPWVKR